MPLTTCQRETSPCDPVTYPRLEVNVSKIRYNMELAVGRCRDAGIQVSWVVKGFNGIPGLMKRLYPHSGCAHLASSRLRHLEDADALGLARPYMLIRIPMKTEVSELVRLADYSLESEPQLIDLIETECALQGRTHHAVLMADLGDLREGFWDYDQLISTALHIERDLKHVKLAGIGTNLGCYGSIAATPEKMNDLIAIAEQIETQIGRPLEIVSGGASTSYPLVEKGTMPQKINHLRLGEQIELALDAVDFHYFDQADTFFQDTFVLKAEVIEVKEKPSYPVGELSVDCFGNAGVYQDRGIRKRALLGVGKLDYGYLDRMRCATPGVEILGASSDHTILDIEDCEQTIHTGDVLSFYLSYSQAAFLSSTPCTSICYMEE